MITVEIVNTIFGLVALANSVLAGIILILKMMIGKYLTEYEKLTGYHEGFDRLVREKNRTALIMNMFIKLWMVTMLIMGAYALFYKPVVESIQAG
ncbi:MAG: hypothetical protein Q4A84_00465 [Neisseria sp.]|uniref:hypothetical protein n=1 Tax=Neisseria sp. TaxID=192066 RepID=UPI0026DDA9C1|nr:hypothetical protein [Neisseria sp.]MDO4640168.1 hypothetical protein [Neisseria sp.]